MVTTCLYIFNINKIMKIFIYMLEKEWKRAKWEIRKMVGGIMKWRRSWYWAKFTWVHMG